MRRPFGTAKETTPLNSPDIRLRAAGVSPPMRYGPSPWMRTPMPSPALPVSEASVPVTSVPRKLPSTRCAPPPTRTTCAAKRLIASPRSTRRASKFALPASIPVFCDAPALRNSTFSTAFEPPASGASVFATAPGWV